MGRSSFPYISGRFGQDTYSGSLRKKKSQIKYENFYCSEIQLQRLTADKPSCFLFRKLKTYTGKVRSWTSSWDTSKMGPKTWEDKGFEWNPGLGTPKAGRETREPFIFHIFYPRFFVLFISSFNLVSSSSTVNYLTENGNFSSSYILE